MNRPPIQARRAEAVLWGVGLLLVCFQWWGVPLLSADLTEKWLWSVEPSQDFPPAWRLGFPLMAIVVFFWLRKERLPGFVRPLPPHLLVVTCSVGCGVLFWLLRVRTLELGDARLILDHFLSLETYASVREPLESILHTEFARITFLGWGMHPQTTFQLQSCLIGALALLLTGWGLIRGGEAIRPFRCWIACIFFIAPVHLFFGYIEWYTQLAAGILVFEVFALIHWTTGRGLGIALAGIVFAACSHLVALALVPSAVVLILHTRTGSRRWIEIAAFLAVLGAALAATLWWIQSSIHFEASVQATTDLFSTLLPFMCEDNPNNPPGSWTYAWLSLNHLSDIANEIFLCGLFSLALLAGIAMTGVEHRRRMDSGMKWFFGLQLAACGAFLLIWNPWLGFPGDWDLFSFFAWPLLGLALFMLGHIPHAVVRRRVLIAAAFPAFSVVSAWVIHHHQPEWITLREAQAVLSWRIAELRLEEAREARSTGDWRTAFEKCEEVLKRAPAKRAEVFTVIDSTAIQEMSELWGDETTLIPLAVDFEILSASPMTRFLVLDCWGRLFFQEGGRFNDWSIHGLPEIPTKRAVDFEIVPWRKSAVILRDDGDLFEVPVSSIVAPNPASPRETFFLEPPIDREPKRLGNFYRDFSSADLGRGQRAVDLTLDHWNRRMIVLNTAGGVVGEGTGTDFDVYEWAALARCDVESNYNGEFIFVTDHFGKVTSWPGKNSSIEVLHQIGWPAITDLELTRGGNDLYLLDGQGGVTAYSRLEHALIDPSRMNHFHPTGEPLDSAPYVSDPIRYFIDLEIPPGERSFYKMTSNFRIHFSEQREE